MSNILKSALCLGLCMVSAAANTHVFWDQSAFFLQCKALSKKVASFVPQQKQAFCVEQLILASTEIDMAANHLLDGEMQAAKEALAHSVLTLQYAALNSCRQYIQISHSKFEANQIKNSL